MPPAPTALIPKLKPPPGACDTHIHIYDPRFPKAATAKIDPPPASVADYLTMCKRLGVERTVVVQPSTYGTDNRCTLEAMAAIGPGARAVVVVDTSVSDAELDRLTRLGARGLRFFMGAGAPLPWDIFETMAARIAAFGWHVNVQFDGRDFAQHEGRLTRAPCRIVIDHTGKFLEPVPPEHPGFMSLLRLIDTGKAWVKLAAPYETSKVGPPHYDDVGRLAKRLALSAPERMLWASNWPHPSPGVTVPDDAVLLDMLLDWLPDDAARRKALADNPAELYGY